MAPPDLSRRFIAPEWLDDAPPEEAGKSLGDLRRINRFFGGHRTLQSALRPLLTPGSSVLDVGAATADHAALLRNVRVVSADLSHEHLQLGKGDRVTCDGFALPFAAGSFDIVIANLFLHHFEDEAIVELLRGFRRIAARAVVITDLERHLLAWYFLPFTAPVLGWHPLTLHDGPVSVAAAFQPEELRTLFERAGMQSVRIRKHRPWFRISAVWVAGRTQESL